MPRIWTDTLDSHRRQVHDAILDATAELIAERGPLSVAMSAVAERSGIGRATLYKYFPNVESILVAWHARTFADHVSRLRSLSAADDVTLHDLAAFICVQRRHHRRRDRIDVLGPLARTVAHVDGIAGSAIEREIITVLTEIVNRLVHQGAVRDDQDPEALARWLLHAAHAPADLDDQAVAQLVVDSLARDRISNAGEKAHP